MKLLFLYIHISFLLSLEYAIIYEDNLHNPASSIANLYSNQVDDSFKLDSEIFSKNYIEAFSGDTITDKVKTFILELKENYPELNYILILGDENSFPPIYNNTGIPSDDFFTLPDNNTNSPPTISIGRIPSSDINKINTFVEKLTEFLLYPTIGPWRDKAILIADDENKNGENEACEINHTKNSDIIYDILSNFMDVKTFYGIEYEPIMTSDGLEHLALNQDIINEINQGFALINYIGHGDQKKLSAEKIISLDDLPDIAINNKFGLWVVGTCKFGQYDNDLCMAEELITSQEAAIGVISTVRAISSAYNTNFLTYLFNEYSNHFNSSDIIRIGDIINASKNTSYENNSFYQGYVFHLFGDPALPIFSSKQLEDYNFPDSINLINQNIVENNLGYDFGNLLLNFTDEETDTLVYGNPTNLCNGELSYTKPGDTVFENNFTDISCFNIPLDAMNCNNCDLKMRLYYQNNMTYNGISYLSNSIELNDQIDETVYSDDQGPEISFDYQNLNLTDNSIVPDNAIIQVNLSDSSGINIFKGIGHNLRYWFNNDIESTDIDFSNFNYSDACSGIGQTNISLPNNYSGNQQLFVEAWDNLNNRTIDSIKIHIGSKDYQTNIIDKFINLPNPFSEYTYFTYQVPNQEHLPIDININIFNLDGKLVKNIKRTHNESYNTILWDGKNINQQQISNGTYLINIEITSFAGIKQKQTHLVSKIN